MTDKLAQLRRLNSLRTPGVYSKANDRFNFALGEAAHELIEIASITQEWCKHYEDYGFAVGYTIQVLQGLLK